MKECRVQVVDNKAFSMSKPMYVRERICYCGAAIVDKLCMNSGDVDSKGLSTSLRQAGVWHVSCYI
jgi:hypothetical protein